MGSIFSRISTGCLSALALLAWDEELLAVRGVPLSVCGSHRQGFECIGHGAAAGKVQKGSAVFGCRQARDLGGNFRKDVHAPDLGGDPEVFAKPLLHPQYTGMAADPALFPGGQLGRENQNQFQI
jgi:hypothetical protein